MTVVQKKSEQKQSVFFIISACIFRYVIGTCIYHDQRRSKLDDILTKTESNIGGQHQLAYFGTESYDAGVIAARLLMDRLSSSSDILMARIIHSGKNDSNQGKNSSPFSRDAGISFSRQVIWTF